MRSPARRLESPRSPHRFARAALTVVGGLAGGLAAPATAGNLPWTTTPLSQATMTPNEDVGATWLSPDGRFALFAVLVAGDNLNRELRCVRLDGQSLPVTLTAGFPDTYRFSDSPVISPDSRRVAFAARVPVGGGGAYEIWSAPLCRASPAAVLLSPAGTPATNPCDPRIDFTPDSSRVVYSICHDDALIRRIYSVPAGGGAPAVELGGLTEPDPFGSIPFAPTADSQRLILPRRDPSGFVDILSVPIAGPASAETILVHGTVMDGEYPFFWDLPVAGRLAFLWQDPSGGETQELFSTPLAGPPDQHVRLNPTLVDGGRVLFFHLTPDGARVVYLADQAVDTQYELYSVPVAGPSTSYVKLNPPVFPGSGGVSFQDFEISADSSRVFFEASIETLSRLDLYAVPAAGPASSAVRLNLGTPNQGSYSWWGVSPDGSYGAFTGADSLGGGDVHLRRADGGGPQLNLGCTDSQTLPTFVPTGLFTQCRLGAEAAPELHHFYIALSPFLAFASDVTPLDDTPGAGRLQPGASIAGGALFTRDSPTPGEIELFAADWRITLNGFETGDFTGWTAVP